MATPVNFSMASAERIADVVRKVEAGSRDADRVVTAPRFGGGDSSYKIYRGTFVNSWYTGDSHVVTLAGRTNTITVTNYTKNFWDGDSNTTATVLFSKVNGTMTALEIGMDQCRNIGGAINKIVGFSTTSPQILGHQGGCLKWYDTVTCSTATTQ